jgi:hypothetical protein
MQARNDGCGASSDEQMWAPHFLFVPLSSLRKNEGARNWGEINWGWVLGWALDGDISIVFSGTSQLTVKRSQKRENAELRQNTCQAERSHRVTLETQEIASCLAALIYCY